MSPRFWPIADASQAAYEHLREAALAEIPLVGTQAACFERYGLAGLIKMPAATVVYEASLVGARRPLWSPYADPRVAALAAAFGLLLASPDTMALHHYQGVR